MSISTKIWALSDLESVAKTGAFACLPMVLLNRIMREAVAVFDAPKGAIVQVHGATTQTNGVTSVKATLLFDSIKLSWGVPGVGVRIEHHDDRFSVRIGGAAGTAALGYTYDVGWTEETPAELFPALFSCVLESIRTSKELT